MKLKDKVSWNLLPFIFLVAIAQGLVLYFFSDFFFSTKTPAGKALMVSATTLIGSSLLVFIIRQQIGYYFSQLLEKINWFAITILDGKQQQTPQENLMIDEIGALDNTLDCLRNSVNIHQKSMEKMAFYDSLTGLPNKEFLKQELKRMLTSAKRHNNHLAVLYLDLDEFKTINDTLGHDIGDVLLSEASKRMQHLVRGSDYVDRKRTSGGRSDTSVIARLAGDEFTLLLGDIDDPAIITTVAKRVLEGLGMPFQLNQHEVQVGASIGIAVFPEDGQSVEQLLKNADFAMFEAKKQGKNNFQFYTKEMNDLAFKRLTMESGIRKALEAQEFAMHFHPRVNLKTHNVTGFEALLRWDSPKMGLIPPDKFLPIAEETILVCEIGNWVFDNVCQNIKHWIDNGFPDIRVSINLSQMQIYRGDTYNLIKTYMALYGIAGKNLEIEVTEEGILKDEKSAIILLKKLKDLGITISLDDFGVGYASITFLQNLPIDVLKIDSSMGALDKSEQANNQLLKSVIDIAHNFNLMTVASGLEEQHQVDFVKSLNCDYVQGYYYSKPIPADDVVDFLHNWDLPEELTIN